jgi:hypothetical protein
LQKIFAQAPVAIVVFRGRDFVVELANPFYQALLPGKELVGRRFADIVPELGGDVWEAFHRVMDTGSMTGPEKKLLEGMLERGLGVQRKKPAPRKAAKKSPQTRAPRKKSVLPKAPF